MTVFDPQSEDDVQQWYSIVTMATMFDCTVETVRNWIKEGKFPNATRLGGNQWRVPRSDVLAFVRGDK